MKVVVAILLVPFAALGFVVCAVATGLAIGWHAWDDFVSTLRNTS